ncbi:hypothetical protein DFH06DRAFT_1302774 [Mycena polygramma]|nr:hypothetical protein DFH06DRAFT_1302774 [Mycena polygramma]
MKPASPDQCQSRRWNLCCISHEGLEGVFKYLLPREVRAVALLCRRLNRLSVDILLATHGIPDPAAKCEVRLDPTSGDEAGYSDVLAALQFSVSIPSINHFAVTVSGPGDTAQMARHIRRCRGVLQKFPSIHIVCIEFLEIAYDARNISSGCMSDPLKLEFHALLDTIAALPALESVRVATGWHFDSNYMLELFPSVVGLRSTAGLNTLERCKNVFRRRSHPLPQDTTKPITFLIDTPILVLPSFYGWTMAMLSSRSITALRLHMLIAPVDWTVILPEIADAVPRLRDLTVLGVRMPILAFIRSVSRFRKLATLTTDSTPDFFDFATEPSFRLIAPPAAEPGVPSNSTPTESSLWRPAFFDSSSHLANLTVLATRPEHLEVLLQARTPLPTLRSLCIRMELMDLNSTATVPLMRSIIRRLSITHPSLPLSLDVRANISPEGMMCHTLDIALSQGHAWDEAFGSIANLRIRDWGVHNCTILAWWTTVFRGVANISLTGISPRSPTMLKAEICRMSPRVRAVTVEGHPVDTTSRPALGSSIFLDLPDDIFLTIFEQLVSAELYGLSRLSRRLNLLALPLYLAQKGVPHASDLCDFQLVNSPTAADVLSALSSALFLREVKRITCQFKPGAHIFCYIHNIERLTNFFAKFPSVQSVSLTLVDLGSVDTELNALVRRKWRAAFGKLLNMILEKLCKELSLCGGLYMEPGASDMPWPNDDAAVNLSPAAHNNSALRTFHLRPTTALSHSAILWIFSALRASQISVLHVSVTCSALLYVIAQELPALCELVVISCSYTFDAELLLLLCKLPCLLHLSLPLYSGNEPFTLRTTPTFTSLQTLVAPALFISHLLIAEVPLPSLERLEIRTSMRNVLPSGWSVATIITAFATRTPAALPTVVFHFTLSGASLFDRFDYHSWWNEGGLQTFLGDEEAWGAASGSVHGLVVHASMVLYGASAQQVLGALLPHFPVLCELVVDDKSGMRISDWEATLAGVRDRRRNLQRVWFNDVQIHSV